jgi:hypothetical protein
MNCSDFPTGSKSQYYNFIMAYLEKFFECTDAVYDLRQYFKLFSSDDVFAFRDYFHEKILKLEKYHSTSRSAIPDIKLIRWKACYYKLCKVLNLYTNINEKNQRLKIANEIFETYLQAMVHPQSEITPIDQRNFEDIIVIAYIILRDSKVYDFSVLNPFNYFAIVMLETARKNNPMNRDYNVILLKLYDKLGCTSKILNIMHHFHCKEEDYEKLGYFKFSHLAEYGKSTALEAC